MKKMFLGFFALGLFAFTGSAVSAQMMMKDDNPMVGGAAMYKTKNIVENAVNSADHTTLVAAVKAAGLVDTLSGTGPFTVFAPVNSAFDALPAGRRARTRSATARALRRSIGPLDRRHPSAAPSRQPRSVP